VDEVVGTGCTYLADGRRLDRGGEGDGLGASVDLEHNAVGVAKQGTAERGERAREEGHDVVLPGLRDLVAAEAEATRPRLRKGVGGTRDVLDSAVVALLGGVAPRDEPVLFEQYRAGTGVLLEKVADLLRHREAGTRVVEPDRLVAECVLGQPPPLRCRRQRD